MAILKPTLFIADIRGSIGAVTYLRTQGGLTARDRVSPAQPPSADRDAAQAALRLLSQAWSSTLTPPQRQGWLAYDGQHPQPDRWGGRRKPAGYLRFIGVNYHHARHTGELLTTAPPTEPPLHQIAPTLLHDTQAAVLVTGNGVPDPNGLYRFVEVLNNRPSYLRQDAAWRIWQPPTGAYRFMAPVGWAEPEPYFRRSVQPIGTWSPRNGATGNPLGAKDPSETQLDVAAATPTYPNLPADAALYLYAAKPIAPGARSFAGPHRLAAVLIRTAGAWVPALLRLALPWPAYPDLRVRLTTILQDTTTHALSRRCPTHSTATTLIL